MSAVTVGRVDQALSTQGSIRTGVGLVRRDRAPADLRGGPARVVSFVTVRARAVVC
ncbi:hypothetical protein FHY34_001780 [Xanthomonas arboricola]|nr:hypothetical protein [Xanthomonas arboricola]